jgi:hypothetical protein
VSGLALGALAVGALAAPGPATPDPQGVLPAAQVPNVAARLSSGPGAPALTPAVAGPDAGADATPAVAGHPAGDVTETTAPTGADDGSVLDPRVRDQLERRPVAFYYPTP